MASHALVSRPFGPPCPFGSATFGGPLSFPPLRGMLAIFAFHAVRSAACYLFSSRTPSFMGGNTPWGCRPPWLRTQDDLHQCYRAKGSLKQANPDAQGSSVRQMEMQDTGNKQSVLSETANDERKAGKKYPALETPQPALTDENALTFIPAPAPSSALTPAKLTTLTPMLLRTLPSLRTTAASLQTLLASNNKLAAVPVTGYVREALATFVWACDVMDVLGGLVKAGE